MKHDQPAPFGLSAQLDLDIVSDQDYLKEFEHGYTGFEETNEYFVKFFGRELDGYDDSTRVNRLNLNRGWSGFSLNSELRWYDNVVNRRQSDTDCRNCRMSNLAPPSSRFETLVFITTWIRNIPIFTATTVREVIGRIYIHASICRTSSNIIFQSNLRWGSGRRFIILINTNTGVLQKRKTCSGTCMT